MADTSGKLFLTKAAIKAWSTHFLAVSGLMLGQLFLRILCFVPIYLHQGLNVWDMGPLAAVPGWAYYALTALLYLMLVLPLRFYAGERLRFYSGPNQPEPKEKGAYWTWMRAGLVRHGRGLLWGLPFITGLGLFLYAKENLPFNEMGRMMEKLCVIFFLKPSNINGYLSAAALLLIFLVIFLLGWRRDMPMEYLPVRRIGVRKMLWFTAKTRRRGKGQLFKNTLGNIILSLPAVVLGASVLYPYVRARIRTSSPDMLVTSVLRLLKKPLPAEQLMLLFGVLLLAYLPYCTIRKMRNAVLVRRLTKELQDRGGRHEA